MKGNQKLRSQRAVVHAYNGGMMAAETDPSAMRQGQQHQQCDTCGVVLAIGARSADALEVWCMRGCGAMEVRLTVVDMRLLGELAMAVVCVGLLYYRDCK